LDAAVDNLVRIAAAPKAAPLTVARPRRGSRSRPRATAPDTVDDRWLAALCGPEPRVDGSQEELVSLRQRCREWRRPVAVVHEGPFRLCFRLEEPAPEEDEVERPWSPGEAAWTLRYLIQSNSDPSLIVPAAEAWRARGRAAAAFKAATGIAVYKWDVGDFEACKAGVARIEADLGPVEVLVNNAGITRDGMLHRMAPENWRAVITTNLDSLFNMTRNVIEGMRGRGYGRVISISSINGQKGQFGQSNYAAAKAGLIGFTKSVAQENAAKGITVNAVAPGYIGTEMVRAVAEEVLNTKILPLIPVGRLGEPEEVARCVVFLASEEAGYITGSTLTVNGGQYMA
jgi:acetoacetyl-CoA reductase